MIVAAYLILKTDQNYLNSDNIANAFHFVNKPMKTGFKY